MKFLHLTIILSAFFLLTACPGARRESSLKQLQDNGMDFPNLRSQRFSVVKFQISELFDRDYGLYHTLQDQAIGFVIHDMNVHFTVERFGSDEVDMIQFAFDDDIGPLDAVHDNYILKREASLIEPSFTGIKKELPETVNFPGFVQVVEGASSDYSDILSYFTATLEIGNDYYVFQLIGKEGNMEYLYDDFLDILSSAHI
ncbi:MAG: hypothetical protein HWE22_11005 [Flavobacteriales bacterium]|nr:hypothetical protein [Flavobacteriales bacterium]